MAGTVHPIVVVCKRMRGRWNGGLGSGPLNTLSAHAQPLLDPILLLLARKHARWQSGCVGGRVAGRRDRRGEAPDTSGRGAGSLTCEAVAGGSSGGGGGRAGQEGHQERGGAGEHGLGGGLEAQKRAGA